MPALFKLDNKWSKGLSVRCLDVLLAGLLSFHLLKKYWLKLFKITKCCVITISTTLLAKDWCLMKTQYNNLKIISTLLRRLFINFYKTNMNKNILGRRFSASHPLLLNYVNFCSTINITNTTVYKYRVSPCLRASRLPLGLPRQIFCPKEYLWEI